MVRMPFVLLLVLGLAVAAFSEGGGGAVLGACGSPGENEAAPAVQGLDVAAVPLPGQRAINFELPAVVGDEIETVKLSDYNGKWRVLCFYPADFTFV